MAWYKLSIEDNKWKHNQGFINAKVVRLYYQERANLPVYTSSLTEKERDQARKHLKTVMRLRKKDEQGNYYFTSE